jgi:hypothetical protein
VTLAVRLLSNTKTKVITRPLKRPSRPCSFMIRSEDADPKVLGGIR